MTDKGVKNKGVKDGFSRDTAEKKCGVIEKVGPENASSKGSFHSKKGADQPIEISENSGNVRSKIHDALEREKEREAIPVLDLEKLYVEMRGFIDELVRALPTHKKQWLKNDENMFLRIITDIGFGSHDLANSETKLSDEQKDNLRRDGSKISSEILGKAYRYWEEHLSIVINILKDFDTKGMATIASVEGKKIKLNEQTISKMKKLMDSMTSSYLRFGTELKDRLKGTEQFVEMNDLKNSKIEGMDRSTLKDGDMTEDFVDSTINALLMERLLKALEKGSSEAKIKETLLLAISSNFSHLNLSIASQIKQTIDLLLEDIQNGTFEDLDQYIDDPYPLYDSEGKLLAFVLTSFNRALRGVIESQRLKSLIDKQNPK